MSGSYVWHHCLTALVFLHFHLLLKWMPRYLQSFATLTSPPRIHKDYVDILFLLKTITLSLVLSTFRADDFSQTTPQNHPLLVPCTPPPNPPTLMHLTTKEPSENLLQIAWPWVTLKVWGIKGERGWAQHTVCSVELLYCSLSQSDRALLVRRPTVCQVVDIPGEGGHVYSYILKRMSFSMVVFIIEQLNWIALTSSFIPAIVYTPPSNWVRQHKDLDTTHDSCNPHLHLLLPEARSCLISKAVYLFKNWVMPPVIERRRL